MVENSVIAINGLAFLLSDLKEAQIEYPKFEGDITHANFTFQRSGYPSRTIEMTGEDAENVWQLWKDYKGIK